MDCKIKVSYGSVTLNTSGYSPQVVANVVCKRQEDAERLRDAMQSLFEVSPDTEPVKKEPQ